MRAARQFVKKLESQDLLVHTRKITVELFGSLAMTGKGHATDKALVLGLEGEAPESIDPDHVEQRIRDIEQKNELNLLGHHRIAFSMGEHLLFLKGKRFTYHSNAMRFKAFDARGQNIASEISYSVGGGFVVHQDQTLESSFTSILEDDIPYPYQTCEELLAHCEEIGMSIAQIAMENEKTWRSEKQIKQGILHTWKVMQDCVQRGYRNEGYLPGGLEVKRRAPDLYRKLSSKQTPMSDPSEIFDWVSLFALAVNEENAAGGRVVTAPTNGAAGIIPAALHYYQKFTPNPTDEGIVTFFLTATAIGILYKEGASLSAAEMGCQGEVGVACSMAAGGLAAALGGITAQIVQAAEIGMEHNLGLTCDPVAGLVQIPCIERNTMGAIKAINAMRLALNGDGSHRVSLDQVIAAMRQTGEDMNLKYKETSEAGLAHSVPLNLPAC
jgi:L-serine dehydratase